MVTILTVAIMELFTLYLCGLRVTLRIFVSTLLQLHHVVHDYSLASVEICDFKKTKEMNVLALSLELVDHLDSHL